MRVLLVSTYELGHQPIHVASPASRLTSDGHQVRCLDLSVDPMDPEDVQWAEVIGFSVPMHTAMRLAVEACTEVRRIAPSAPVCFYGLYALVDADSGVADKAIAGEYEPELAKWIAELAQTSNESDESTPSEAPSIADPGVEAPLIAVPSGTDPRDTQQRVIVSIGKASGDFGLPARELLPPLERYARLEAGGERRLAGYVEASHGCSHRCRHCPVPVVYDGRTRVVGIDALLADIAQLVAHGAEHLTFGDPDFLNRPRHACRAVQAVHGAFPDLTFDVTVKVEHIIAHSGLWPSFRDAGCLFVVSAFESTSDRVLRILDKGHSARDEFAAVKLLRDAGIEPRPSLLPFTPWSEPRDIVDLLDFVARCDLVGNIDPVQFAIRLLVPPGSLLLTAGLLDGLLDGYDPEHLGWTWHSHDQRLDTLADELGAIAAQAGDEAWPPAVAYTAIRHTALQALGYDPGMPEVRADETLRSPLPPELRPRLSEPWFCCAEPTCTQLGAVRPLEAAMNAAPG
jgi:radical SAM superfamily enzyme YgiQ (UPF0313 family)